MKNQLLDFDGLTDLVTELKKYVSGEKVLSFYTSAEFPSVGKPDTIYIDTTKNALYRWDDEKIKYDSLVFDLNETYILNCGSSGG